MIPAGFMYKKVVAKPDWIEADNVRDIYSVSHCVSHDFCDWINFWKHNGYWFFDNLSIMEEIAIANNVDLGKMKPFYYRVFSKQWDAELSSWSSFSAEKSFQTVVSEPLSPKVEGFDVVTYSVQTSAECSPLSCNNLAKTLSTNAHCLFETFEEAHRALENGSFDDSEPGPFRILEVNSL
jgi:hypothetical protein